MGPRPPTARRSPAAAPDGHGNRDHHGQLQAVTLDDEARLDLQTGRSLLVPGDPGPVRDALQERWLLPARLPAPGERCLRPRHPGRALRQPRLRPHIGVLAQLYDWTPIGTTVIVKA